MSETISLILNYVAIGFLILWAVANVTRILPFLLAKRIVRREGEWDSDTVEFDRLGVFLTVLPAPVMALPWLFRLVCGLPTQTSWAFLLLAFVFAGAVLFQTTGSQLRYNDEGIFIRGGNGKEYFIPEARILSVTWQIGNRRDGKKNRLRSGTPTVAIRYQSDLFGKPVTDVYFLYPEKMRGISRFLAFRESKNKETAEKNKEEAQNKPQVD